MMTPIEAHRAGLRELRYADQFIAELAAEFDIPNSLTEALWNCLEGAADAYMSITQEKAKHDFEAARRVLATWKKHLDGVLTFVPALALFEGDISLGRTGRLHGLGVRDETSFALAFHHLAGAAEIGTITDTPSDTSNDWRSANGHWETLGRLSLKVERMLRAAPTNAPRKDALRGLKLWTYFLMGFWVQTLGMEPPPLTKSSGATKGRYSGTANISRFATFCERCGEPIGIRPNFRTSIQYARKRLDRELQIEEALRGGDHILAAELLSASKDTNS